MLDVLRDQRVARHEPEWFPASGERELEHLARERLDVNAR